MFDDVTPKQASPTAPAVPPPTLPTAPAREPEDMLASVEGNASPERSRAVAPPPARPDGPSNEIPAEYLENRAGFPWKIIGIVAAAVVIIGIGGIGAYSYLTRGSEPSPVPEQQPINNQEPASVEPLPSLELQGPGPTTFNEDPDADGLSVDQEIAAGTDLENPDTDGDGLFDGEEVRSFGTDPLKADTDGDGYSDGDEVRNGYNPKGPGRLFSVPE